LSLPVPQITVPQTPVPTSSSSRPGHRITLSEIQQAFHPISGQYGPILDLAKAASLAGIKPSTLKRKVSEGHYRSSVRRGKPLQFWRDRFVSEHMNSGR
jgi:hypothetical protein